MDESWIDVALLKPNQFWNICAAFITAIYQKFGGTEEKTKPRKTVTKILETHAGMKNLGVGFPIPSVSFTNLAEDLTTMLSYTKDVIFLIRIEL